MGLFSRKNRDKRRRAARREPSPEEVPWFAAAPDDEDLLALQIEANRNAAFTEEDLAWLRDDPGEEIRRRRRE